MAQQRSRARGAREFCQHGAQGLFARPGVAHFKQRAAHGIEGGAKGKGRALEAA